jgi:hypothetical protein
MPRTVYRWRWMRWLSYQFWLSAQVARIRRLDYIFDDCPPLLTKEKLQELENIGRWIAGECTDHWHDEPAASPVSIPETPKQAKPPMHFKSGCCIGEKCSACGNPATHKVGEEQFPDDMRTWAHNLTAYVCCEHFKQIMGRCEPLASPVSKSGPSKSGTETE